MTEPARYDSIAAVELARLLGVPRVEVRDEVGSTQDVAHALAAAGHPAGTVILADRQSAGRGRSGRRWASPPDVGIWVTIIERPRDAAGVGVLSLRVGLAAATVLDPFAPEPVRLKWPNDVYSGGKLAGVLVEARWRDAAPEWVAIGIGVNVAAPPDVPEAGALRPGVRRVDVLRALVPAVRDAASRSGCLTMDEIQAFGARDLARGARCEAPVAGIVRGIDETGALLVAGSHGLERCRGGSLVLGKGHP